MKIFKLLLFSAFFMFAGCSSDDDDPNAANGINRAPNLQATGSSANDFLAASKYNTLAIEVFYVSGFRPNPLTLTNLRNFMAARLNKPGGISIVETEIESPGLAPYDINEIVAIESDIRTKYNNGNTLALYLFFADGGSTTDTNNQFTLGSAYRNTSFVMYESTIQNLSNGIGEPNRVDLETTVIEHELGHLLGIVNLGSPMQADHEDTAHPKHCTNPDCLMYWQAESSNVIGMMAGGNVPQLDANCLADLQANGGK